MKTASSKDSTKIAYDEQGHGPALILVNGAMTTRSSGSNPVEYLHGGRLARTVRSQHRKDLAASDLQIDSRDRMDIAVGLGQATHPDDRGGVHA